MQVRQALVVEDDPSIRTLLATTLGADDMTVVTAATGEEALRVISQDEIALALVDLQLPDMDGAILIERLRQHAPSLRVIVMTGFGTVERAVQAMRAGAVDFLRKPFDLSSVRAAVCRALGGNRLRSGPRADGLQNKTGEGASAVVGGSDAMRVVVEFVNKVADSDSTVLITGESGTGKEVLARTLHAQSRRRQGPLIPINCGAIPEALLESELFGHERGAFSGAQQSRPGRFELAHGGTLFLDEIGEMPPALQVKLLRAVQERCFERVGGTRSIKVDVRIVAATNQDLEAAVRDGRFRKDLYYRLNVIPVVVPPLRERREDVPVLVHHFVARFNRRTASSITGIESDAMDALIRHEWPGNVRELENLIERLVVLKRSGAIELADLPEMLSAARSAGEARSAIEVRPSAQTSLSREGINLMLELEQYENQLIMEAMVRANGITSKAARLLHLNRTTLVEKLKRKKLDAKHMAAQDRTGSSVPACLLDESSIL